MTCTSPSGVVAAGSNVTVAVAVIRFTDASRTPGVFSSVRCTRLLHAAQVMPETRMLQVSLIHDDLAPDHPHPAGELVHSTRQWRELDGGGPAGWEEAPDSEIGDHDLLGAARVIHSVELEVDTAAGTNPHDRRGVAVVHHDARALSVALYSGGDHRRACAEKVPVHPHDRRDSGCGHEQLRCAH